MAVATPSGAVLHQRVGRLQLSSPTAFLPLTAITIDPAVSAHCLNRGAETMNLRLDIDRAEKTLTVGAARPSADGKSYPLTTESLDGATLASGCPGFVGPSAPISFAPQTTRYAEIAPGAGLDAKLPWWNLPVFDDASPWALPLKEVVIHAPAIGQCVGRWNPSTWCDADSLGWTTGGSIVGHLLLEDADHIAIKAAGCQSLCAILVNDATKTDKGLCKRGPDGKVPAWGDACVGGSGCKNAFTFSATFASYEVLP